MAHDVFISYAIEDRPAADAVCRALEQGGIRCWYAPRDVPFGARFEEAILDAIYKSRLMIVVISSHANASAHVTREIQSAFAEDVNLTVLPFRIEEVSLNRALKYYIGSLQWFDALTLPLEPHLERLTKTVQLRLQEGAERQSAPEERRPPEAEETERLRPTGKLDADAVGAATRSGGKRKRTMLVITAACVVVLTAVALIWAGLKGASTKATINQNSAEISANQASEPAAAPSMTATTQPGVESQPAAGEKSPGEFQPAPGEESFWLKIDESDIGQLELYLKTFPNGFYKGLANLKLIKLRKLNNIPMTDAVDFDSYPGLEFEDEKARLDNLAVALHQEPGAQGYYIIFGSCEDEADQRSARAVDYLVNSRGIERSRMTVVNGGCRERLTVELWLRPTGAMEPIPSNSATVSPCPKCRRAPSGGR